MDTNTTVNELKEIMKKFCEERDWDQFHNPKELAIGISTEANELLEHFRFKSEEQMEEMMKDPQKRMMIQEELADVLAFVLRFAQKNDFDLSESLIDKMSKNGKKYPVSKSKGNNIKYNE